MKVKREKITSTEETYICEVCGKQSKEKYDIQRCEENHKKDRCDHKGTFSWGCWIEDSIFISKRCIDCGKIWKRTINSLPTHMLEELFEVDK